MANELTDKRSSWKFPILAGSTGVTLAVAGIFSRLTNPPSSLIVSAASGVLGLLGLWLYLGSDARDREQRLTASLGEVSRQRLRKQRPLSVALAITLFLLIGVPVGLSFFATWIDRHFYNGVIGICLIGMIGWCVSAAAGHFARHRVLDEHERGLAAVDTTSC